MQNKVVVFDSPSSFDRYTIVVLKTGEVFGASTNPFHPQGFGQFAGTTLELTMPQAAKVWFDKSIGWWPRRFIELGNKAFIFDARKQKHLGIEVKDLSQLPEHVQKYIEQVSSPTVNA